MYRKLFKKFGERIILLRDSHATLAARNGHFGEDVTIGAPIPWAIQRIRQNFPYLSFGDAALNAPGATLAGTSHTPT